MIPGGDGESMGTAVTGGGMRDGAVYSCVGVAGLKN
jgi:hypothetical protein